MPKAYEAFKNTFLHILHIYIYDIIFTNTILIIIIPSYFINICIISNNNNAKLISEKKT